MSKTTIKYHCWKCHAQFYENKEFFEREKEKWRRRHSARYIARIKCRNCGNEDFNRITEAPQ